MAAAAILVDFLEGYAAIGIVFALVVVFAGIGRIDPVTKNSTLGFRMIVLPGSILLWPLLMSWWMKGGPKS